MSESEPSLDGTPASKATLRKEKASNEATSPNARSKTISVADGEDTQGVSHTLS